MSETPSDDAGLPVIDELAVLKQRASLMGLKFSNNISVETLKAKIAAKMAEAETGVVETADAADADASETGTNAPTVNPLEADAPAPTGKPKTLRQHLYEKNMWLVRVRITNLDPKKKDLQGEIITVANEYIGTVRKFVPFGAATDEGYHVPFIIYKFLKERVFLSISVRKVPGKEQTIIEQRYVPEFAIEVLDPLTPYGLSQLAAAQAAAGGLA